MESQCVVNVDDNINKTDVLELGYMICKRCSSIIATLPTNRVRRFYGECKESCENVSEGVSEFD